MTCITVAILGKVDERLRKRLEDSTHLKDHLISGDKTKFLLATTETKISFDGVDTLQMDIVERQSEDLIALIADRSVDYSLSAYKTYADPFNTPSLVEDQRIGDGFILKADRPYDSPQENLKLLRAIRGGARLTAVHRRSGEVSAVINNRILLARCGPYHPKDEEILKPYDTKAKKTVKLQVISFNIRGGKITVDNTHKPKTVKMLIT